MKRRQIYRFFDRYLGIPILWFFTLFLKKSGDPPEKNAIKKILFVKFAAIGDIILLTPALRLLRKEFPNAEITFLCTSINYGMAKNVEYVDKIIKQDVYPFIYNWIGFFTFIKKMRKTEFDVIIDAEQWSRIDSIIIGFLKSKFTIGFNNAKQYKHRIFSTSVPHHNKRHEVENFFALLEPLGIIPKDEDRYLEYKIDDASKIKANEFWNDNKLNNKKVICFQPSCGNSSFARAWSDENYIELGKKLIKDVNNLFILVTGIKSDYEECKYISDSIGEKAMCIAGKFNMNIDLAIIQKAECILCSNTGILHLAASVGALTVGMHGPNNPVHWGAYTTKSVVILSDIHCSPCVYLGHDFGCNAPVCMARIKVDDVYLALRKLLDKEVLK